MITADIFGGLGNQLFIVFATISLAMRHKSNFYFVSKKEEELERIDRPTYWNNILSSLDPFLYTNESKPIFDNEYVYKENNFRYNPELYSIYKTLSEIDPTKEIVLQLHGYFQSCKYFTEYYPMIYRLLKIDEQKIELFNYLELYAWEYDKTVSMHFRIGDYLHQQHNHPVLKKDYYKNALSIIKIMKPSTDIVLYFCEKENLEQVERIVNELRTIFPMKFILADQTMADWQQLLLMSCCANNIIANSTFSWWGAYLNTHLGKIVIYPETWFGPALSPTHDVSELCPPEWICIEE